MNGLIRSDFIKLRKSRTLLVCCILAFVIATILSLVFVNSWNSIGDRIEEVTEMLRQAGMSEALIDQAFSTLPKPNYWSYANMLFSDGTIYVIMGICISVFMASEYTMGTLKNTLSRGFSRTQIYISKFIVSCVSMLVIVLAYQLGGVIVSAVFLRQFAELNAVQIILSILSYLCIYTAMASVYCMVAVLVKKTSSAVAISLAVPILVSALTTLIIYGNYELTSVTRYWLFDMPSYVQRMCVDNQAYLLILVSLGYLVVSFGVGITVFRKQEVK